MSYFARFSPLRAIRDLRLFLAQRERHELWFLLAAIAVTGFFVFGFIHDSYEEPVYRPNIVYVQQWRADRTDDQVRAQQARDKPAEVAHKAAVARQQAETRAEFQRLDDKLKKYGF